jgi:DNA-binding transcriptional MerR regulator
MELVPWFILQSMSDLDSAPYLRSTQLAVLAGVSTDTLRHYERKGLLGPRRSSNGYREYPRASVERVLLVQNALMVGFTLDELSRILREREDGGRPCHEVRELAASRLKALENQIRALCDLRDVLGRMLATWDEKLSHTKAEDQARLLDMLSQASVLPGKPDGKSAVASRNRGIRRTRPLRDPRRTRGQR